MIDTYHFGSLTVDGRQYSSDLIILPDRIIDSWWRKSGHCLHPDDLPEVVQARPTTLVIGTGTFGVMQVPPETIAFLNEKGIVPAVFKTDTACQEYNKRKKAGEAVAAALHLTC
jgi:hypothetical protein